MENKVKLKDLYISFFKIGLFTFGGGLAMLPMLEKEIVDKKHWCTVSDLTDYYAIGQCTPGIIAVNTATFIGYKHRGLIGGIVTTLGIISPSLIIITIIAMFIRNFAEMTIVKNALKGLGAGVCAIIIPSIIKLGKSALKDYFGIIMAILAFCVAEFTSIPIFIIVIVGIIAGIIQGGRHDLS